MKELENNIVTRKTKKIYNTDFTAAFYLIASVFLIIYSFAKLDNILTPLAIAILIWFLINAFANQIRKLPYFDNKIGDFLAIPLSLIIIVFFILEVGSFITSSISELSSSIQQMDSKVSNLIEKTSSLTGFNISDKIEQAYEQFSVTKIINKIIAAFGSIVSNILQILLYVLFLLMDQRYFNAKINALFKNQDAREKAKDVLSSISKTIRTYLSITTIISLITGVLTYIICEFLSLEGSILWAFLAFLLNFIPTIGSIVAVAFPSLFALVQFSSSADVIILTVCLILVQFIVGNIIYPKLMGNKLNISEFVVILSLVIWGTIWGTIGMFLSVPMMMILLIILSQFENTKNMAILISRNGKIYTN